jgi:hypothetical protein
MPAGRWRGVTKGEEVVPSEPVRLRQDGNHLRLAGGAPVYEPALAAAATLIVVHEDQA